MTTADLGYWKQPHAMYDDPDWRSLTLPQRAVWELLRARCNFHRHPFRAVINGRQVEAPAFSFIGSTRTLATDIGCAPQLVRQTVTALVARGWLDVQQVGPKTWAYHATKAARWQAGKTYQPRATLPVASATLPVTDKKPSATLPVPSATLPVPSATLPVPSATLPVADELGKDLKGCTRSQEVEELEEVKKGADGAEKRTIARTPRIPKEPKPEKPKLTQEAVAWLHDLRRDIVATDPKSRLASDETWKRTWVGRGWAGEIRTYLAEGHEVAELERLRRWLYSSAGSDFFRRRVHTAGDFIRHADSIRGDMSRPRTSASRGHIGVYRSSEHVHDGSGDIWSGEETET